MTAALDDLKILDLSNERTGAQVSQFFADFGADVIQVERPGGSELRSAAAWPFWGRGKRAVQLDLKSPDDVAIFLNLAAEADVVIDTFRPGVADRLGIGYEQLKLRNPRLVYVAISAFGADNALSHLPGYEGIVAARTGVHWSLEGMADCAGPCFCAVDYACFASSQLAIQGALAALLEREDSGTGQKVDVAMAKALTIYDIFGIQLRTLAKRFEGGLVQTARIVDNVPTGGISFRLLIALTKDGRWLQFSQSSDRLFRAMMKMFELDWMFDDPEWSTAPNFDEDLQKRIAFWEILLNKVREKTVDEWMELFDRDPNVWGEMFRKDSEVLHHPQMEWNKMVVELLDKDCGLVRQPGTLAHLSATPAKIGQPAPRLGEHDAAVRAEAEGAAGGQVAAVAASSSSTRPALAGMTVVELSSFYAAPYGCTLLGELGARVIKLEELAGDAMRSMLPFPESGGMKCMYGKESVAVDLTKPEGREIALRIIDKADIVLCSFREGSAERLRLDAKTLCARNPNLLYMNAPGYGIDGPYARRPAFAPTIGAAAGLGWRNAGGSIPEGDLSIMEIRNAACRLATAVMGVGNADGLAAVSVGSVMALGLLARKRGGLGQEMFTSMLSSTAHGLSDVAIEYAGKPRPSQVDDDIYGFDALYRLYRARDGEYIFLAIRHDEEWRKMTQLLPQGDILAGDARFADDAARRENDAALIEALTPIFATRDAQDWETLLAAERLGCVVAARGPLEANYCDDDKLGMQMGWMTTVNHPILDEVPRMKPLIDFSRSQTVVSPAGLCGQETEAVLTEFGYSKDTIADLEKKGVIMLG
ncbi:CaiB/BaiF CoA transferase family protein [Rhizorhapis sp. SPR117]|uniref:CaiB/BaiF CoA transferase family protein n=1 Tax=Rhizorhapis sp. SPR117 TaxID=2912611 RepID=UPI001F364683|nr:CoA transferase [Rhizorhapis sp. SPR117]